MPRLLSFAWLLTALALGWAGGLAAAPTAQKADPKKPPPAKTTAKPAPKPKTAASAKKSAPVSSAKTKASRKSVPVKSASAKSRKPVPNRKTTAAKAKARYTYGQAKPSVDRYSEIQKALQAKGYYHGETDGAWGEASAAALKRFQTDQNLKADGKVGSLSLIALGLGLRRGAAAAAPQPVASPAAPAPAVEVPPQPAAPADESQR